MLTRFPSVSKACNSRRGPDGDEATQARERGNDSRYGAHDASASAVSIIYVTGGTSSPIPRPVLVSEIADTHGLARPLSYAGHRRTRHHMGARWARRDPGRRCLWGPLDEPVTAVQRCASWTLGDRRLRVQGRRCLGLSDRMAAFRSHSERQAYLNVGTLTARHVRKVLHSVRRMISILHRAYEHCRNSRPGATPYSPANVFHLQAAPPEESRGNRRNAFTYTTLLSLALIIGATSAAQAQDAKKFRIAIA